MIISPANSLKRRVSARLFSCLKNFFKKFLENYANSLAFMPLRVYNILAKYGTGVRTKGVKNESNNNENRR